MLIMRGRLKHESRGGVVGCPREGSSLSAVLSGESKGAAQYNKMFMLIMREMLNKDKLRG